MIDLLEEVIVTPRRAFPRLPDLQVIERPGWLQIITPSIKTGSLNEVIYSLLDEAEADAAIDTTIAMYRERGLKFRWNAAPGSGPPDLGERLERRGLAVSWGRGVARSTEVSATSDDIVEVDARSLDDFTHVMATGWGADHATLHIQHEHMLAEGKHRFFVAYCDGAPAAGASYIGFARSAFMMSAVVLPPYRGRGLYRAHAHARGIPLATSHAREATSAPILEKLGFETVCRFAMYYG